jgi:small subunit ribosomal protein S11
MNKVVAKSKTANKRTSDIGILMHVQSTKNNVIVSVTDSRGNVLAWSSGGKLEKGARKRTAHAAKETGKNVAQAMLAKKLKVSFMVVYIKGIGSGRESAVIGFCEVMKVAVTKIIDRTAKAHGGGRKRKAKRN